MEVVDELKAQCCDQRQPKSIHGTATELVRSRVSDQPT
ncbi:hypothetical protein ABIC60_000179 [Phyllobacterium ifriqiyense]